MWNLKYITNDLSMRQKQTHRHVFAQEEWWEASTGSSGLAEATYYVEDR